ncbi:MAG: HAD-IC family P-type ATPase, partial [Nitrospirae bacterium]|nr:HAD-IC family P-type ATPase [Nitrospirota bacterium]
MLKKPWSHLEIEDVLRAAGSSRAGLSPAEAERRIIRHGPNLLAEENRRRIAPILLRQFTNVMTLILLAAAAIAGGMGDLVDAVMILVIVGLNAALGFSQEYRAERALAALRKLEQPQVVVRREGRLVEIPSQDLVPGDLMALDPGRRVPADGRLIETAHLTLDEAHLTGESAAAVKHARVLRGESVALGDRSNMVFMGTAVQTGHAWAVVTETGMKTELGKIARLLQTMEDRLTPLQIRLGHLGKWLAAAALGMTAVIFLAGLLRGEPLDAMLLTAISLAVAVIPEGFPAVVTIVLALGAQSMVRRNALIRKLPAVETLGCVTTICSDKTGTLTQNIMSVEIIHLAGRLLDVTGNGYRPEGRFYEKDRVLDPRDEASLRDLLRAAVLCTEAGLQERDGQWTVLGDPTEGALLVAAAKAGLWKAELEGRYPRIGEIPFDSVRKLMTTVHRDPSGGGWVFTKGGIDEVLRRSTGVAEERSFKPMLRHHRDEILRIHRELAGDGIRVLACASRRLE